jgi:hypothetical protein
MIQFTSERRSPQGLCSGQHYSRRTEEGRGWGWQWAFPASSHYLDPKTGNPHRHEVHESAIQKAVHQSAQRAGLTKSVTHVPEPQRTQGDRK